MTISCEIENINKEIEIIKKNQIKILEMRSTIIKMKKLLGVSTDLSWQKKESVSLKAE